MDIQTTIDGLARELGVSDEARRQWRSRGWVPHRWRLPILQRAAQAGLIIPVEAFDDFKRAA